MTYVPVSETSVSSNTTNVNQRGFGTILCLDEHNFTLERIVKVASVDEAGAIFPTYTKAYKAAVAAFSVDPKPKEFAIGRRLTSTTLLPATPSNGMQFQVKFKLKNDATIYNIQITAGGGDTVLTIGTSLASAINTNYPALGSAVTATSVAGLVTIVRDSTSVDYMVFELINLTAGAVASGESVDDTMKFIKAETTDFYHIVSTDRTQLHIEALSNYVAASKNTMSFATSLADCYLNAYGPSIADWPGKFKVIGRPRNINVTYCQADQLDLFPEIRVFAVNSGYQPGDVIYSNKANLGILPAKTAGGLLLTESQRDNLAQRGINYFESFGGVTVYRRGFSQAAGASAWADDTVAKDLFEARANEALANFLFAQASSKVGAGLAGYGQIESVVRTVGDAMTTVGTTARAFQQGSFDVIPPTADEIREARPGRVGKIKCVAKLEGAIDSGDIELTVSY